GLALGLQLVSIAWAKRADEREGERARAGHQLSPVAVVLGPPAGDHLGDTRDVKARRAQELGQHIGLPKPRAVRAVAGQAEVVPARERREALEEEVLGAGAQAAPLARHGQAAPRPQYPIRLGERRRR